MIKRINHLENEYPKFQSIGNASQFAIPFAKHVCKGNGVDIGCNRLDWAKIIENANKIYTVSTSNLFLIETLSITSTDVNIYPRLPRENNFDGILEFTNKNFKLIL